jgi:hypothetical protein
MMPEKLELNEAGIKMVLDQHGSEIQELRSGLIDIQKTMVGWERCKTLRDGCNGNFTDIFARLNDTENACARFNKIEEDIVTVDRMPVINDEFVDKIAAKLEYRLVNLSWCHVKGLVKSNRVLQVVVLWAALELFGIYAGRFYDIYQWLFFPHGGA